MPIVGMHRLLAAMGAAATAVLVLFVGSAPVKTSAIKDVCEDGQAVHIVMELCCWSQDEGHYNERKAAEIKDDDMSIKAIDFGLPMFFKPNKCSYMAHFNACVVYLHANIIKTILAIFCCLSIFLDSSCTVRFSLSWLGVHSMFLMRYCTNAEVSEDKSKAYNVADLGEAKMNLMKEPKHSV
uniref:Uncharacterized protein n=1 Tax=Oryza meridionalis TaxID=40149 RepID=A0A0E0D990_9ORYZ